MRNFDSNFDRNFDRAAKGFVGLWIIGAVLTIAFWVVVIWAIVQGVQWLQTK